MKNQINFSGSTLIATRDDKELQLNIEDLYFIYNDDYFNIMLDESHTNSGLAVFSSKYSDLTVDGETFTGGADELEALVKSHIGGGGEITIDAALDANSQNAVANSAITQTLSNYYYFRKINDNIYYSPFGQISSNGLKGVSFQFANIANPNNTISMPLWFSQINGKEIIFRDARGLPNANTFNLNLIETSAIQTTLSSSSTDEQVPSAKAVYDALGDIETLLSQI